MVCPQVANEIPEPKAREVDAQNAAGCTVSEKGEPLIFLDLLNKFEFGIGKNEDVLYDHCRHMLSKVRTDESSIHKEYMVASPSAIVAETADDDKILESNSRWSSIIKTKRSMLRKVLNRKVYTPDETERMKPEKVGKNSLKPNGAALAFVH